MFEWDLNYKHKDLLRYVAEMRFGDRFRLLTLMGKFLSYEKNFITKVKNDELI